MNSKGHLYISILKSLVRIVGCAISIVSTHNVKPIAISFLFAEMLGIAEELVDNR